jgi:hypothetical protein
MRTSNTNKTIVLVVEWARLLLGTSEAPGSNPGVGAWHFVVSCACELQSAAPHVTREMPYERDAFFYNFFRV